jgi:hypothetical protein
MSSTDGNGFVADRHEAPRRASRPAGSVQYGLTERDPDASCSGWPARIFIFFVSAWLCVFSADAQDRGAIPKTISVCDLMRDPSAFNGIKIAIRGVYDSFGHGLYLSGEGCEMVHTAKGNVWPAVINIVLGAGDFRSRGLDVETFQTAEMQLSRARVRALTGHDGAKIAKLVLTYVGLFETRDGLSDPRGFGPGSAAPGQLFVDSVRDIVVTLEESSEKR